jgi:hypothetical protein
VLRIACLSGLQNKSASKHTLFRGGGHARVIVAEFAKMTSDVTDELDDRANSQQKVVIHDCKSKCSYSQADNTKEKVMESAEKMQSD